MSAREQHIVIVGAGQAGVQALTSLREGGFGGAVTLIGDEPYPPYQRPPLSKAYLAGAFERERLFLKSDDFLSEACRLRLGTRVAAVERKEKRVRLEDGLVISYDKLLLTTGARPRRLACPGADLMGVCYLRGIDDADGIRAHLARGRRLTVVGGGYIGLEVAAVATSLGVAVTVIETADRLMPRTVSPPISAFYEEVHRAHGVRVLLGATVDAFEGEERLAAVRAGRERIAADAALVGIGAVANCELASAAGFACDNGVLVDEFARTADADIFAAGDCTTHPYLGARVRIESVQNAIDQAKIAALGLMDKPRAYNDVPWFWSDQFDLKLQIAGVPRPGDSTVLRGDPASRKFAVFHLRENKIAAVEAVNAAADYIVGRKLIASGKSVAPARLADPQVSVKSLA